MLPVAILGSDVADVQDIDASSLLLEGVAPLRWRVSDVAGPAGGEVCDCGRDGPDGFDDLTFKFKTQEIVATLGDRIWGEEVVLTLTGSLLDGTPFEAADCVVLRGAPKDQIAIAPGADPDGDEDPEAPGGSASLRPQSSPNEPVQRVQYEIPEASAVRISVYDVSGRRVTRLVDSYKGDGTHVVDWNASGHPSGIYFLRMETRSEVLTRKITLVR